MTEEVQGATTPTETVEATDVKAEANTEVVESKEQQAAEAGKDDAATEVEETIEERYARLEKEASKKQRRIDRQRMANSRLNEQLQDYAKRMKELEERFEQSNPKVDAEPKIDDFETLDEYVDAVSTYRADKERTKFVEEQERLQNEAKLVAEQNRLEARFKAQEMEFQATVPDYQQATEVFNEAIGTYSQESPALQAASKAMLTADNAPQIGYYLSKNLDALDDILTSESPESAFRKVVKLEMELANQGKPAPKREAPKPVRPVKTSGAAGSRSLKSQSPQELVKWLNS